MLAVAEDVRKGFIFVAMSATIALASGSSRYGSIGHNVTNHL
jgi:hypothetical protein